MPRKLSDGEWSILREQNIDAYHEQPAEPVELITEECPQCRQVYTRSADDPDPCCSPACIEQHYAELQAEANAAMNEWWQRELQQMHDYHCPICGKQFRDYPTVEPTCSRQCAEELVARLYVDYPTNNGDYEE